MVRSLAELGGAWDVAIQNAPNHGLHFKIPQEALGIDVPFLELAAVTLGLVIPNTFLVLLTDGKPVKEAARVQRAREFVDPPRNLNDGNLRELRSNEFAFRRVVIEEHHRVQGEVKLQSEFLDVRRLVRPVNPISSNFVPTEQAVRVAVHDLPNRCLVVLAAQTNQKTLFGDGNDFRLEAIIGDSRIVIRIEVDFIQPAFTNHTAPKGVIAIQDQHFFRRQISALEETQDFSRSRSDEFLFERRFHH